MSDKGNGVLCYLDLNFSFLRTRWSKLVVGRVSCNSRGFLGFYWSTVFPYCSIQFGPLVLRRDFLLYLLPSLPAPSSTCLYYFLCYVIVLRFSVCYLVSRGPGFPAVVLLMRPGLGCVLLSTVLPACLGPAPRPTSTGYVFSRFPCSYFWIFTLDSGWFLRSSIIDHQSLLNSYFQDSFDVTLVCDYVHFGFV